MRMSAMFKIMPAILAALFLASAFWAAGEEPKPQEATRFSGYRALVIPPENPWASFDIECRSMLVERGMDVEVGRPELLADPQKLARYDIVVTNVKRQFTDAQVNGLKEYLFQGGALYGSRRGGPMPMDCQEMLEVCGAKSLGTAYVREIKLEDSPLAKGLGPLSIPSPEFVGDLPLKDGLLVAIFKQADGVSVASDCKGNCLGILKEHGKGRTALLGFTPENYKFVTTERKLDNKIFENLLAWLLPSPPSQAQAFSGVVEVNLPRRAQVLSASLNGAPLERLEAKTNGSLKSVLVPVHSISEGETASIKVDYQPLAPARNIETWIHNPCGEFIKAFDSPSEAAEFLSKLGATTVQPLLRYAGGSVCYRPSLPGDYFRDKKLAKYQGDYLADYISECHKRGIRVVGGLYVDWERYPQINQSAPLLVEKDGKESAKKVCPLNEEVQARNLEIVSRFLAQYPQIDALILDDNYEFQNHPCHCAQCKNRFHDYCARNGKDENSQDAWKEFWKEMVKGFLGKVRNACKTHGKKLGGWRSVCVDRLSQETLDFQGAMAYAETASSIGFGICSMPEGTDYISLLWGMNRCPDDIAFEFAEAVREGSANVGFWIAFNRRFLEDGKATFETKDAAKPYAFQLYPGSLDAIARAFAGAEKEWLNYYRDNILGGDARFVVLSAEMKPGSLTLKVKNTGKHAGMRIAGPVDLGAISNIAR